MTLLIYEKHLVLQGIQSNHVDNIDCLHSLYKLFQFNIHVFHPHQLTMITALQKTRNILILHQPRFHTVHQQRRFNYSLAQSIFTVTKYAKHIFIAFVVKEKTHQLKEAPYSYARNLNREARA